MCTNISKIIAKIPQNSNVKCDKIPGSHTMLYNKLILNIADI